MIILVVGEEKCNRKEIVYPFKLYEKCCKNQVSIIIFTMKIQIYHKYMNFVINMDYSIKLIQLL